MSASRRRWLGNAGIVLFWCVPLLFWFFGARMALYRIEQRELATRMPAEVARVETRSYSCKDSDGNRRTCYEHQFTVWIELNGDRVKRVVLQNNFDPEYDWHSGDEVDPETYTEGSTLPVLLRRDLGNAVAPDLFWAAYGSPVFLIGFGVFCSIFCVVTTALMWQRGPRRS